MRELSIYYPNEVVDPTGELLYSILSGSITSISANDLKGLTSTRSYAFAYSGNLTKIDMPYLVTAGFACFQGCVALTEAKFGENIQSILGNCFYNCSNLTSVIINKLTPPTLAAHSPFSGTNANLKIYVPDSAVDAYKEASNWSTFADKIFAISEANNELGGNENE